MVFWTVEDNTIKTLAEEGFGYIENKNLSYPLTIAMLE